jgi:hypothetical protein
MALLTFDRRQAQLLCNLGISHFTRLFQRHAPDQLGQIAAARDGGTTAKGLELDVGYGVCVLVDADLQLHDVAAGRSANKSGADVRVAFLHRANISRVGIVIQYLFMIVAP